MPRPPRLFVPGCPQHLSQRGHNLGPVFHDDEDRQRYLAELAQVLREQRVALHGYALLPDQVMLLLTPPHEDALGRTLQSLGRRYVAWFNQRHGRRGTLWEGRFRTQLVDPASGYLACLRHVELAPVRAGLVTQPEHYPWSSAPHHLGQRADATVTDAAPFWQLGNTPFEREAAYRRWLEDGQPAGEAQAIEAAQRQGRPWADAAGLARLERELQCSLAPRPRGRPRKEARPAHDSGTI